MRMATKPFFGCQRGKRDIALNIKTPEGLEIAQKLITKADVVHHNMTRGVATKLGIDYASCRALRADIVYCNTYAYGLEEPLGKFGGLDPLYQAAAGLEYEAGATHEGNPPLYYRFGMCDQACACQSAVAVLLALEVRLTSAMKANSILYHVAALSLILTFVFDWLFMHWWGVVGIALAGAAIRLVSALYLSCKIYGMRAKIAGFRVSDSLP